MSMSLSARVCLWERGRTLSDDDLNAILCGDESRAWQKRIWQMKKEKSLNKIREIEKFNFQKKKKNLNIKVEWEVVREMIKRAPSLSFYYHIQASLCATNKINLIFEK